MIEARRLTKIYGDITAVSDLTFTVRPGIITGFLGPNGAGKSTTMRMIVGLHAPTSGTVTVGGRRYHDVPVPLREMGALLDARAVHRGVTARNHLLWLAASNGIPRRRVDEVLGLVGLEAAADRRAGQFSLGMAQRLGIAAALLGNPAVLMLDEPLNGLDPEGIRWIRSFLRTLADEGRAVLLSSHLMSEMAMTADHLVVIGRGRIIADTSLADLVEQYSRESVLVRTPQADTFAAVLRDSGGSVQVNADSSLIVTGVTSVQIGSLASTAGVTLAELTPQRTSLEDVFMELTSGLADHRADGGAR